VFCGGVPARPAPDLPAELAHLADSDRPLALVTLGTTFANDETFFRLAAESVLMVGGQTLVVTGRRAPKVLASLQEAPPGRSTVVDWIDYRAVFPHLAAVVHHGGVATTHAALVHGIPQVVVPHAGDQFPQAARITQAFIGYGIRPRDFTLENVPMIVADAVYDEEFRENALELAEEMQALGGVKTAVDAVERM
jgi:UDP:flavonoid glycosyltransferase YjiC (YdhE family)